MPANVLNALISFITFFFLKNSDLLIPVIFLLLMLATKLPQVASSRNQMHLCHCRREQICLHWSLGHRIILHPLRSPGNWVWCPYSTKKYIWQIYGMFDEYNQYIAHVMVWSVWYVDCRHLIAISVDKAHIYSDSGGLGLNPSLVHYYSLILSNTHPMYKTLTQCAQSADIFICTLYNRKMMNDFFSFYNYSTWEEWIETWSNELTCEDG